MKVFTVVALICFALKASAQALADGPTPGFDAKVAPILARRCLDCHSGAEPKGKLDLSRRASAFAGGEEGVAIVAGRPDESLLWEKVESGEMPPKGKLPDAEKAVIRDWIALGAAWGTDPIDTFHVTTARRAGRDWWSLQSVRRPVPPSSKDESWGRSPIDAFVRQKLQGEGLKPSPEADRTTLIRRLSFDLLGLPPTPEVVDAFLAERSPGAYERLADRYLNSPQYGVRWARWWLDLARYGESNGFEFDEFRPSSWRYRDWVVDALNRDLPYDEFARLQLAGDVLRPDDVKAVEATGFLVAGAFDTVGQNQLSKAMKEVVRGDELEDVVGAVGQTFLGLTVNCARCHDHKFDPIRQTEYYQLASALGGVRHGERDLSAIAPESRALRERIGALAARVTAIEAPARAEILARRKALKTTAPEPVAAWDFDRGPDDRVGSLKVTLHGKAKLTSQGLELDGRTAYATTPPLKFALKAKTIEAWVRLSDLAQRGGGVVSLHETDGDQFDAIVFAEREPGRWMPGSENFVRTRDVGGETETEAVSRPVHFAITYADNGIVRCYRDGQPYGKAYRADAATFEDEETEVLFGVRHLPAQGNRMLAGTVVRARLYGRALDPSEVAASAESEGDFILPGAIAAALPADKRKEHARLVAGVAKLQALRDATPHTAYAVSPSEAAVMRVQIRGNPALPGDVVRPGGVAALTGPGADFGLPAGAPECERRERLASWVTGPQNPLFARVLVNRLWQAHFGTGLVENSSDLGFNGGMPSHPELLDWLASELVERGWGVKAMHRLIVTSATYRQSSRSDPTAMARDVNDRLLWRKAPTRLEAEMVRDAMLALSGRLDTTLGGPSYRDHESVKAPGTAAILYKPIDPSAPGLDRRTLFRAWARGGRSALLDAFDCPDPSTAAPRRAVTTTPLQALAMMNNALVLHLANAFAARLLADAGTEAGKQVDRAYRLAFGRLPDADERARAVQVVETVGTPALARAIFNSNEFLYVD